MQAELRSVDGHLSDAVNVLQRGVALATQAATSTQDAQTRSMIREEVDGLLRHLVAIGNSVYSGRRVFAGADDSMVPFDLDEATNTVTYQGSPRGRSITFPDGRARSIGSTGEMTGRVMSKNTRTGLAPRSIAASSID